MKRSVGNLLLLIALTGAVVASFALLQLDLAALFTRDGLRQMAVYATGFAEPDFSTPHLRRIGNGALETLAMSGVGTLLAVVAGLSLALPAAGRGGKVARGFRTSHGFRITRGCARLVLNMLRAVPELVWAALMVLAAGLGPAAGTLALALHTTGVLGRLFAEALENTPPLPAEAIRIAGGGPVAAFCYGTLPLVWPQLLAYALYRWENNIRMAAILGFVGAGGLGQLLYTTLSLFQQAQAATVMLAMLVLVLAVDAISARLRQRWVAAG